MRNSLAPTHVAGGSGRSLGRLAAVGEIIYFVVALGFLGQILGMAAGVGRPTPLSIQVGILGEGLAALVLAIGLPQLRRWAVYGAILLALWVIVPNFGYTLAVFEGAEGPNWSDHLETLLVVAQVIIQAIVMLLCLCGAFMNQRHR